MITGASDGLGKEFAQQLAGKGYNLVLISRTQSKLTALASALTSAHPTIEVKIFPLDYTLATPQTFTTLAQLTAPLDVSLLINNVGQSHDIPVSYLETPAAERDAIVAVNVTGTLRTTSAIAPQLVARRRGLILVLASFAGVFPTPLLATYSGSKAFLTAWGQALGDELRGSGVKVQVVQSHLVVSAMSKVRRASVLVPTAGAFVRKVLGMVGRSGGSQGWGGVVTPWWSHALMQWVLENVLGARSAFLLGRNREMHVDIRRRALRKREREAKKQ